MFHPELQQLTIETLQSAQLIPVIVRAEATHDELAAASALVLSLQALGKQAQMVAPADIERANQVDYLVGVASATKELGNKDLHILFPYHPDAVDKVSYHIDEEEEKFYLVIQPQRGAAPLNKKKVEFMYAGAEADVIVMIGVNSMAQLGVLKDQHAQLLESTKTVVINNFQPALGDIKLNSTGSSSISEAMVPVVEGLQSLTTEAATNLLAGIEEATNRFQSLIATAETFATVSKLMQAGARRVIPQQKSTTVKESGNTDQSLFSAALSKSGRQPENHNSNSKKQKKHTRKNDQQNNSQLKGSSKKIVEPDIIPTPGHRS